MSDTCDATILSGSDDMLVKLWRYVAPAESETWRSQVTTGDGDATVTVTVFQAVVLDPMWTMWTEDCPKPLEICIIIVYYRDYIGIL